jgi:TrmH family RNA methyltransferase
VPIGVAGTEEVVAWLREHGLKIVAASPGAPVAVWDVPLAGPAAIVVGAEQYGLSQRFLSEADVVARIDMPGGAIDSLNAAASAAVLLFEAVRQRSL